jgi:hypothetical protein
VRKTLWLGGLAVLMALATAHARSRSGDLIATLKGSNRPLAEGAGDCQSLSKYHRTLGALVSHFERQANGRRKASCTSKAGASVLRCSAEFGNKVPRERSEEEFFLRIEFELDHESIGPFQCFLAG